MPSLATSDVLYRCKRSNTHASTRAKIAHSQKYVVHMQYIFCFCFSFAVLFVFLSSQWRSFRNRLVSCVVHFLRRNSSKGFSVFYLHRCKGESYAKMAISTECQFPFSYWKWTCLLNAHPINGTPYSSIELPTDIHIIWFLLRNGNYFDEIQWFVLDFQCACTYAYTANVLQWKTHFKQYGQCVFICAGTVNGCTKQNTFLSIRKMCVYTPRYRECVHRTKHNFNNPENMRLFTPLPLSALHVFDCFIPFIPFWFVLSYFHMYYVWFVRDT